MPRRQLRRSDGLPPEWARIAAHEQSLGPEARRAGAHYTPWPAARGLVERALDAWSGTGLPRVLDPTCGAGSFLLAAAEVLVERGADPGAARAALAGADLDVAAARACQEVLDAWGRRHGLTRRDDDGGGAIRQADLFGSLDRRWRAAFDVIVGNPPFQGQLSTRTSRTAADRAHVERRFGPAARGYVDTAAVAVLASLELAAAGGVVAMIQPRSFLAASAPAGVRAALATWGDVVGVWLPDERVFGAEVDVCAVVARHGAPSAGVVELWGGSDAATPVRVVGRDRLRPEGWGALAALARGVPDVVAHRGVTLGDGARVVAGFRDEFYAIADAVREASPTATQNRVVTTGLIDPAELHWGCRPTRIGGRRWERPVIELDHLEQREPSVRRWVESLRVPKVLVATQTEILEAVADPHGDLVALTPTLSVLSDRWSPVETLAALCAPPASAWAQHVMAGTGRSRHTLRVGAPSLRGMPMPVDRSAWAAASRSLSDGDAWERFGRLACASWGLDDAVTEELLAWWVPRVERRARRQVDPARRVRRAAR